jgi:hypothetical protein
MSFCGANTIRTLASSVINTFNLGYVYAGASMLTMSCLTNVNMNGEGGITTGVNER